MRQFEVSFTNGNEQCNCTVFIQTDSNLSLVEVDAWEKGYEMCKKRGYDVECWDYDIKEVI